MATSTLVTLLSIGLIALAVTLSSIKRAPDFGLLASLGIIALLVWRRPGGLEQLGFAPIDNWPVVFVLCIALGVLISLLAIVVLEPLTERLTGKTHDISIVEFVRGDWKALTRLLALVWLLVAILEELIFRGFLMTEIAGLVGVDPAGLVINLLVTSILFGLAHWYQGPSGVISTGIVGVFLGLIFIWAGFNLWPVILTHGFIDTLALVLIYANLDKRLKHAIFKPRT